MSLIDKRSEEIQSNLFEVNHALIQNKYLTSIIATNMLQWYCGKGEIWVQNRAPWAQPNEMERPIPSLIPTKYIDESLRIEADCSKSPKSERSLGGIEQAN